MVKANELRIGNWVGGTSNTEKYPMLLKVVGIAEQVQLLAAENKSGESITFNWEYGLIHPIPLSPELLGKCGFDPYSRAGIIPVYEKDGLAVQEYDGWHFIWTTMKDKKSIVEVKHLHQLQNLYFALTGSEIEVNL